MKIRGDISPPLPNGKPGYFMCPLCRNPGPQAHFATRKGLQHHMAFVHNQKDFK